MIIFLKLMIDFFFGAWNEIVYRPVYNLVVYSYNFSPGPNLGWTIIGLAILIRFVFLYFTLRGYQQDKLLEKVKPEIEKVEADTKFSSREKIQKVSQLTKPLGINPVYESIPIFAQAIFLIALYQILQIGIKHAGYTNLYYFVIPPETINTVFFGYDLTHPSLLLSAIGAFTMFLERTWEYNEKKGLGLQSMSQKWDPLIVPGLTFIFLMLLPSAKAVFIATSVSFSLAIKSIMHIGR